ncbi:MAG: hypothetical protein MJ178_00435 [Treponemataceae bacterium]|nr:hypothetical protein [Treponemataceae bacterium]
MTRVPIRKLLGFSFLYLIILFGIFAIQFRNDSVISKTFGALRLILTETKDVNNNTSLKNTFQVTFNGLTFYSDGVNPVLAGTEIFTQPLVLESWEQISAQGVALHFTDGTTIEFAGSDITLNEETTLLATLPFNVTVSNPNNTITQITLPFKMSSFMSAEYLEAGGYLVTTKGEQFLMTAPALETRQVTLYNNGQGFTCNEYIENHEFTFDEIVTYSMAQKNAYDAIVKQVCTAVGALLQQNVPDGISEKAIVAAVAEMGRNGQYTQGVNAVSASFKNATARRSYLSAPYFNSLVAMNRTLTMQIDNITNRMNYSLTASNPDIYGLDFFDSYLKLSPASAVEAVLNLPLRENVAVTTVGQAAGILNAWSVLTSMGTGQAQILEPALQKCIDYLRTISVVADDMLLLYPEEGVKANLIDVVKAGAALLRYGEYKDDQTLMATGRLLVVSAMNSANALDYDTYGTIYPLLVTDNTWYPHVEVLAETADEKIWAWTCAKSAAIARTADETIITANFPVSATHYMIISGIPAFKSIEIYGLQFRTDPRFETYNSSGYVHQADTNTLLLKYHQRSEIETIRLHY